MSSESRLLNQAIEEIQAICDAPESRSHLFRFGSHGHLSGIRHFYASSSDTAACSVEPGSAEDLSQIMKVIKEHRVPFAVKSGGHSSNPGFSSTSSEGIQISLSRFTTISHHINPSSASDNDNDSLLTIGAGCTFDEIYRVIRKDGYNIVGGGGSVGISGWMLGGGFSLKTNQYGLGVDNLVKAVVVTPTGEIKVASDEKEGDGELFWAIRGGGYNFGIVTEFVVKTHKQGNPPHGLVYGGLLTFNKARIQRVKNALAGFIKTNKDPKANLEAAFVYFRRQGVHEFQLRVLAFYDDKAPSPDLNPFNELLKIPHGGKLEESSYTKLDMASGFLYGHIPADVATKFLVEFERDGGNGNGGEKVPRSFAPASPAGLGVHNARRRWGSVMVSRFTPALIDVIQEEGKAAKLLMDSHRGQMVVSSLWPFMKTMWDNTPTSGTAWPSAVDRKEPLSLIIVYFMWDGQENDKVWIEQMKVALKHIRGIAIAEGCTEEGVSVYGNTTLKEVHSVEDIYQGHLGRLSELRKRYDPEDVMGLTGGFRVRLPEAGDE